MQRQLEANDAQLHHEVGFFSSYDHTDRDARIVKGMRCREEAAFCSVSHN
jgi:hypothetical protein